MTTILIVVVAVALMLAEKVHHSYMTGVELQDLQARGRM